MEVGIVCCDKKNICRLEKITSIILKMSFFAIFFQKSITAGLSQDQVPRMGDLILAPCSLFPILQKYYYSSIPSVMG